MLLQELHSFELCTMALVQFELWFDVITVPADALAPDGARPLVGTVLTTKLNILQNCVAINGSEMDFFARWLHSKWPTRYDWSTRSDFIQNGPQHLTSLKMAHNIWLHSKWPTISDFIQNGPHDLTSFKMAHNIWLHSKWPTRSYEISRHFSLLMINCFRHTSGTCIWQGTLF